MKKRILSLVLSIALLLSLTACGGSGTETTVPPTTTEPAPDAAEIYNTAADKVRSASSMLIDYTLEKTMTMGGDTYLEMQGVNLSLAGVGTDGFAAKAASTYTWGPDYYADESDIFVDGTYYGKVDTHAFTSPMTAEAYQAMYLPGVILTAELYENVEMQDENTVLFSGATALEPWLAQEGYTLVEASGTAFIDATGELEDCTYHAVYTYGTIGYEIDVSLRAMTGPITVEAPLDTSAYVPTEAPEARLMYERAIGLSLQAGNITSTSAENILIEAGAVVMSQQCTMNSYGIGADLMADFDTSVSLLDLSTGSPINAYTLDEQFRNGTYTISTDGGAPQTDAGVTGVVMRGAVQAFVSEMFPYPEEIESLTVTDNGAALLLEYSFTEAGAKAYTTMLCGSIYEDENLLDSLATDYRTDTAHGYVGIDRITGLPLSLGIEYLGIHTIQGTECRLAYDHTQSVSIGAGDAYKTLTGEPMPVEIPEEQATPLLYKVTGENGEQMYLFGTIHVGDGRTANLPDAFLEAFAASDALAVEFDMDAFEEKMTSDPATAALIAQCYVYADGTSVTDHLNDDALAEQAVAILKATGNYNTTLLMMKPVILAQSVENDYIRLSHVISADLGMDHQLLTMARAAGKEILEVETGEEQMQMLTGYSDALQELLLKEALGYSAADFMAETVELYELWCAGDEAAITAMLNETEEMTDEEAALYEEYNKAMSTDRNAAMLEVAKGYLNGEKTVFYAVGLAHLLAEDGLVNTLRDAGYTVELVPCA